VTVEQEQTFTGVMHVHSPNGDDRFIWDKNDPVSVAAARDHFNTLRGEGRAAFTVSEDGAKGEQIREFDPKLERIWMTMPVAGG